MALRFLIAAIAAAGLASAQTASWQKYVVGPSSHTVQPARIVSTSGNVTNAQGLLPKGTSPAVLSRASTSDAIPEIVVDFGMNLVGFLTINFAGASKNTPGIRLAFSETQKYLTNTSDFTRSGNSANYPASDLTNGTDQVAVSSSAYKWTESNGCAHGKQVCADGLHGFRYLKIYLDALAQDAPYTQPNGTVEISGLSLNYTGLISNFTGWFECSDANLTQYWYNGAYTNDMTTDTVRNGDVDPRGSNSSTLLGKQVLYDGAKRDRDPYVGDIGVSGLTAYLTHGNGLPVRNVIADLADHQRSDGWIPPASIFGYTLTLFDYPYWWAVASWEYVMHTGDKTYLQNYYPHMESLLNTWSPTITNTSSQLLSRGLNNTSGYQDYAFLGRSGEVAYFNALYVLALQAGAGFAVSLNQTNQAVTWLERASGVATSFDSMFWDAGKGAYFDLTTGSSRHGQDGNSLAILAGIANATRSASAMTYWNTLEKFYGNPFFDDDSLVPDGTDRVYAFLSFFEISARFVAGQVSSALAELRRLYGWMSANDPEVTYWEAVSTNGTQYEAGFTSCAHGWSTGIVPALSRYVLGVIPTAFGFSKFTLKPYPGDLTWAMGQVPTPSGNITVSWTSGSAGAFSMNFTVPTGTTADVSVPVSGNNPSVTLDGHASSATPNAGYVSLSNVGAGSHRISASSS